jgi:hypothetical protein
MPVFVIQVHAYAAMAAAKLLGRFPEQHRDTLQTIVRSCTVDPDTDVQQRSCEVAAILEMRGHIPVRILI